MSDSLNSARTTVLKEIAQLAVGGELTLDEYADRANAILQATTAAELDALSQPGAAGPPAAPRRRCS